MKAILHIGAQKTGTTTLQHFLAKNRKVLQERSVFFPSITLGNDQGHADLTVMATPVQYIEKAWFAPLLKENGFTVADHGQVWERYRNEIETNCNHDSLVVFSSETLCLLYEQQIEVIRECMNSLFDDVTVVLYLRRQPEWLISLYTTDVITTPSPDKTSFDSCVSNASHFLDYRKVVEKWSIFGKEKVNIRVFDKQALHDNDLYSDFASAVGFDLTGLERVKNTNESIGSAETEFLRLIRTHIDHFHREHPLFLWLSSLSSNQQGRKPYHLTRDQARQILEQYQESNDWIAREYLGREKLFSEDLSMYPEEVDSPHGGKNDAQ
jgi:hypothetical protein